MEKKTVKDSMWENATFLLVGIIHKAVDKSLGVT
jgi:hypothetical protein